MSAGESVARFIGAVTLLALFAPRVEAPDPAKRRFGVDGVAACSQLIDGPHAEGQTVRRLPLIPAGRFTASRRATIAEHPPTWIARGRRRPRPS